VPLLGSVLAVATNLAILVASYDRFGYRGVALGTAAGSVVNAMVLLVVLERRVGGLVGRKAVVALSKMLAAALLMAVPAVWANRALEAGVGITGLAAQMLTGLLPVVLGALVYGVAAFGLRVQELQWVLSALRRRA
jgi:putative peptidoglycan lipid II flippase